jgi:hypothetical protein
LVINAFLIFILILKALLEGFRVNIFCFAFAKCFDFIGIELLSFIFTLLYFYLAYEVVVYQLPSDGEPVGHKWIKGGWVKEIGIDELTVYYPADISEKSYRLGAQWLKVDDYAMHMVDTTRKDQKKKKKIPYFVFRLLVTQFYKVVMYVYENCPINLKLAKKQGDKYTYPIIIISHGLASHCDGYSVISRYLAQQGYIVLCPEHSEFIRNIYPTYEENRIYRRAQLYERIKTIKAVLDIIYDREKFGRLFSTVEPDLSEISIIGHSFGGSTAIYSAFRDSRITGACVAYDPVFYLIINLSVCTSSRIK